MPWLGALPRINVNSIKYQQNILLKLQLFWMMYINVNVNLILLKSTEIM